MLTSFERNGSKQNSNVQTSDTVITVIQYRYIQSSYILMINIYSNILQVCLPGTMYNVPSTQHHSINQIHSLLVIKCLFND